MAELGVQEQFTSTSVELRKTITGDMAPDIRERRLVHLITDLTERIIRMDGTNPRGFAVTVTSDLPTLEKPEPDLHIVATAPLFD